MCQHYKAWVLLRERIIEFIQADKELEETDEDALELLYGMLYIMSEVESKVVSENLSAEPEVRQIN